MKTCGLGLRKVKKTEYLTAPWNQKKDRPMPSRMAFTKRKLFVLDARKEWTSSAAASFHKICSICLTSLYNRMWWSKSPAGEQNCNTIAARDHSCITSIVGPCSLKHICKWPMMPYNIYETTFNVQLLLLSFSL
mmetsp:Transcript_14508/g.20755  ORF Transcript_14508/g.20755 Transcript_14508/m.20755 type:complete len:134 (-) Transcript_14508:412-813(-)